MTKRKKFDKGTSTMEFTKAYLKDKGEEALKKAKKLEEIQVNDGKVWVKEGKTMVLRKLD